MPIVRRRIRADIDQLKLFGKLTARPLPSPATRLVFEPNAKEAHDQTCDWISCRGTFAETRMGHGRYEGSGLSLQLAKQGQWSGAKMA
jgi:hypothetical protein